MYVRAQSKVVGMDFAYWWLTSFVRTFFPVVYFMEQKGEELDDTTDFAKPAGLSGSEDILLPGMQ